MKLDQFRKIRLRLIQILSYQTEKYFSIFLYTGGTQLKALIITNF